MSGIIMAWISRIRMDWMDGSGVAGRYSIVIFCVVILHHSRDTKYLCFK